MIAWAGYMACEQIANALLDGASLPPLVSDGEHVRLYVSPISPDFRSRQKPRLTKERHIHCPWPGNWTGRVDVHPECLALDHGMYLHTNWYQLSLLGPLRTIAVVAALPYEVSQVALPWGSPRDVAPRIAMLNVVDVERMALQGSLAGADLAGVNLGQADLAFTDLRGTNFAYARLEGVNLTGARLQGANLVGAELRCGNFHLAKLRGTNMEGANLDHACLEGADWDEATVWPDGFTPPELRIFQTVSMA